MPFLGNIARNRYYRNAVKEIRRRKKEKAQSEIERLITRYGNRLPYLSHYKTDFIAPMQRTLRYFAHIVRQIPGPVEFCTCNWDDDPLVNAVCTSTQKQETFLRNNRLLKDFFNTTDTPIAYALLKTRKMEKQITGIEKTGNIIRRDALQTAVSFEDHEIVAPSRSIDESRRTFSRNLLYALFDQLAEQMEALKSWKAELEQELMRLNTKFSHPPEPADANDPAAALIHSIEKKLTELKNMTGSPEKCRHTISQLLLHPENHIRANTETLHLSRLGIKVGNTSTDRANTFTIATIAISEDENWTVSWITVPRDAVVDPP